MPDVFISYSRRDTNFVRELNDALNNHSLETWVDWKGIEKGTKWFDEIKKGIERSSSFVFVISPDSVLSPNCDDEIQHAIKCSKKILPIVYRDAVKELDKEQQSHQEISSLNWIFFTDQKDQPYDFGKSLQELIKAHNLDIDYVDEHTRLLLRSLDWNNQGKNNDYLLRGENLKVAEEWLKESEAKEPKGEIKKPQPTELHIDFIETSRRVEDKNAQELKALLDEKEQIEIEIKEKENKVECLNIQVMANEAKVLWIENPQTLDSLLVALKVGHQLQNRLKQKAEVPNLVGLGENGATI